MRRKDRKTLVQTGQAGHHNNAENCEVKVSGSIQVFEPESVSNKRSAERKTDSRYKHFTKIHEDRTHVAAVVLIILTAGYFFVTGLIFYQSKHATETATKQLEAYKDSESGQLVIEDLTPEVTIIGDEVVVNGEIIITNAGPTVVKEIFFSEVGTWGTTGIMPDFPDFPRRGIPPTPIKGGPSLAPGKPRSYKFGGKWVLSVGEMQDRTKFSGFDFSFSYRDIFGRAQRIDDCFMWYVRSQKFDHCPSVVGK